MVLAGSYEYFTYLEANPGDHQGALNRGLIAFDTAGAQLLIAIPATLVTGWSAVSLEITENVFGGLVETKLEQAGYLAHAPGIDQYPTYDNEDFVTDVVGGTLSVATTNAFPKIFKYTGEAFDAVTLVVEQIIGDITHFIVDRAFFPPFNRASGGGHYTLE